MTDYLLIITEPRILARKIIQTLFSIAFIWSLGGKYPFDFFPLAPDCELSKIYMREARLLKCYHLTFCQQSMYS